MRLKKRDKRLLIILVFFSIWIYLLYGKGMRFFEVPSESMLPTLQPGDHVVCFRIKEVKRGDVVVLQHKRDGREIIVKRVIGLPGEVVEVKEGKVFINGKPLIEPYIKEPPEYDTLPVKLPPGHIFVLGDNRNNSEDSSVFGPVPLKDLIGKDYFIYWPPSRIGRVR